MVGRFVKRVSKKAGLPPGSLVHIGEKKTEKIRIQVIDYDEGRLEERDFATIEECLALQRKPSITWINIVGIHEIALMEKIGGHFGLHPLAQEDILNTDQRPKMDDYEDYLCVFLKRLSYNGEKRELKTEQISLVLGPTYVISFLESESGLFEAVRERLRKAKGRIRKVGADYLCYTLMDAVVDNYFVVLEKIGENIESLEEELLSEPSADTSNDIHHLKRELIFLRKSVWPLRDVINGLERGESDLFQDRTMVYLKDLYDHTVQIIDTVETFRDMVSGMIDVYLSSVSNRLNEVMKVLTIIATIFIPLTFLAGVYGMNFKYMPELEWPWGYPLLWLVMILTGAVMVLYFRKRKWL
jgi:magnesium transporter